MASSETSSLVASFSDWKNLRVVLVYRANSDYARRVTEHLTLVWLAEATENVDVNLGVVCAVAFATVMTILSILALTIRGLTRVFDVAPAPAGQSEPTTDAATVGAIQAAVARAIPGGRVVRIESRHKD
jgi:Na+-transporting methylmalonyl-CoA/oxaloacetate decarboxylase gamma subunit